jgi:hypothetical protein
MFGTMPAIGKDAAEMIATARAYSRCLGIQITNDNRGFSLE